MNLNERLKISALWIIRWIIFLPAILLICTLWQWVSQNFLPNWNWWTAIPLWAFFGPVFCITTVYGIGMICPNRKIGNPHTMPQGAAQATAAWGYASRVQTVVAFSAAVW